jgi:ribosomal protein S17
VCEYKKHIYIDVRDYTFSDFYQRYVKKKKKSKVHGPLIMRINNVEFSRHSDP